MYEIFVKLCELKGVSAYKVCKDLGISQSVVSNWKNRGNNLNSATLRKIADYFDVSVDYLETGKEKQIPDGITSDELILIEHYSRLRQEQKDSVLVMISALANQN